MKSAAKSVLPCVPNMISVSHPNGLPYDIHSCLDYDKLSATHKAFALSVSTHTEPSTFKQAVTSPAWCEAMAKEIEALEANDTWTVCDLPPSHLQIDCKFYWLWLLLRTGTFSS